MLLTTCLHFRQACNLNVFAATHFRLYSQLSSSKSPQASSSLSPKKFFLSTQDSFLGPKPSRPSPISKNSNKFQTEPSSGAVDFKSLGLKAELLEALAAKGIERPTRVQREVIPVLLKGRFGSLVFADQTGTGKTFSYLLPVFQALKNEEVRNGVKTEPARPRALILVPNRELGEQVLHFSKHLSHYLKLKVRFLGQGNPLGKSTKELLESGVDILIGTTGKILQAMEQQWVHMTRVQFVVIDEADTMYSAITGFQEDLEKIFYPLFSRMRRNSTKGKQPPVASSPSSPSSPPSPPSPSIPVHFIFTAATITRDLQDSLHKQFPQITKLISNSLHKQAQNLNIRWLDVGFDKKDKLLTVLTKDIPDKKTMIFCNTIECCRATDHFLRETSPSLADTISSFHGGIPPEKRKQNFALFVENTTRALVCTDAASRGIDIPDVSCVVLYDFPKNSVDFLHRVGRTARAGASGDVVCFVQKKDRLLASRIKDAIEKGVPLESSDWRAVIERKVSGNGGRSRSSTGIRRKESSGRSYQMKKEGSGRYSGFSGRSYRMRKDSGYSGSMRNSERSDRSLGGISGRSYGNVFKKRSSGSSYAGIRNKEKSEMPYRGSSVRSYGGMKETGNILKKSRGVQKSTSGRQQKRFGKAKSKPRSQKN